MKVLRSKMTFLSQYFGKSNEVQVKSTLAKKYFVTIQSTQKSNEVL